MKRKSTLYIIIILLSGVGLLSAQNPFIKNYTTFDGLPSNNVYQAYQDSKKFIWFATDAGVCRFDGSSYMHLCKKDGLSCNDVVRIKEDSTGRIWFFNMDATLNYYYNGRIFNNKNAPFLDSLVSLELFRDFFEDSDHTLYFYHNHQREIFSLDTANQVTRFKLPSLMVQNLLKPQQVEGMDVRHLERHNETFYLWTISGLILMQELNNSPVLVPDSPLYKAVFKDSESLFILINKSHGAKYEIQKLDGLYNIDTTVFPISINSEYVSAVIEDESSHIWVSTYDEGVYCYNGKSLLRHYDIKQAQAVIEDHEKNIWITSLKDGAFKLNPQSDKRIHFGKETFDGKGISGLDGSNDLGIWLTNGQMVYLFMNNEFIPLDIPDVEGNLDEILQCGEHTLIVGELSTQYYAIEGLYTDTAHKIISYRNFRPSLRPFKKLTKNKDGTEIITWDFFTVIRINPENISGWKSYDLGERVFNAYYDSDGVIIVNASRNFILREDDLQYAPTLARFDNRIISDHVNLEDSADIYNIEGDSIFILYNGHIYDLSSSWNYPLDLHIKHFEYHSPVLFMATSNNIFYCREPEKIISGKPAGLHMIETSFRNIHGILYRNDQLHVASDDGLTVISSHFLKDTLVNSPIPYFQAIMVNDLQEGPGNNTLIMKGRNKIHIDFSSINFSSSPVIFSYMLNGLDDNWQTANGSSVVYEKLPRGEYEFRLRVRKPMSDWSEPVKMNIRIKATFWEHPLFIISMFVLFAGIIHLLLVWKKNIEMKRQEVEHQLVLLEQRALQSMMNPHFIFNSLGSIQNYLLQNRSREAGQYLAEFARLIRQNLGASNSAMINLEEEVDRLKNYLDLEKMRMEDRFEFKLSVDQSLDRSKLMIPSMIIQPFVENSVWHGISNIKEYGSIEVRFFKNDHKTIKIIVEDNGIGYDRTGTAISARSSKHLKMGMNMTQKRLDLLGKKFNAATGITIRETYPGRQNPGTHVEITVPFAYGSTKINQL